MNEGEEHPLFTRFTGNALNEQYLLRTYRNGLFYGDDKTSQDQAQRKLKQSVVAISGLAGAGGAVALRLAQLGVGKLKLADDRLVTMMSLGRQLGSGREHIGSSIADSLAREIGRYAPEVEVDSYSSGINLVNAESFVGGCDLIIDQTRHGDWAGKIALHRAFRHQQRAQFILSCSSLGWSVILYKFARTGMKLEDWLGVRGVEELTPEMVRRLLNMIHPGSPNLPSIGDFEEWISRNQLLPLHAGVTPVAEGLLVTRALLILLGFEGVDRFEELPAIPTLYCYDASTFSGFYYESEGPL
ncbi:MAG: ThiF family adenylyltransferase [Robiginitomaculum sp.]|nr:ThiF family adenylyltransferase [Robiginitomaculum sp.]MBN4051734.1 ThiF family adenylyltransferase [Parvibaculum lavamentivorans]